MNRSSTMHITCNGEQMAVKQPATLNDLVLSLELNPQTLVAELNGKIIEHHDFAAHHLRENDRIELIRFVGGG
jgi:sulfur carrier protein